MKVSVAESTGVLGFFGGGPSISILQFQKKLETNDESSKPSELWLRGWHEQPLCLNFKPFFAALLFFFASPQPRS